MRNLKRDLKMSIEIEGMIQDHEKRITKIEVGEARLDERLNALVQSTNNLKWVMWAFTLLMLLTIIYQAIGSKGFKDVTSTVAPLVQ